MSQKIAAIDIGLKRIGTAVMLNNMVFPQEPILRKNRNQAASEVDRFLDENNIDLLVVGYPKSSEEMQRRIKHFMSLLNYDKEVYYQNEDMSSIEAEESIKGQMKYKRDGRIDSIAAKIILERYIEHTKV